LTKILHNFLSMLMKKKVLVTGANGFVGSNLVRALLKNNYDVTCMVRRTSNLSSLENLPVTFKYADYHSLSSLQEACKDQEIIFHVAAKVREINEKRYFDANVEVTKNLLESIKSSNVKKFVFLSTQAAAGPADGISPKTENCTCNPVSYYGKSKLEAERVVREECSVPWVIIRPSSVYGPYDKDFLQYFKLVNKHIAPLAGFKKKYFSLVYVEDLVQMIIMAAESERADNEIFFAGDGNVYLLEDFIDAVKKAMHKKAIKLHIPIFLSYILAAFNECLKYFTKKQATINLQKVKEMRKCYWLCSIEKAKKLLNYESCFSLKEGVSETYQWYKEHQWL